MIARRPFVTAALLATILGLAGCGGSGSGGPDVLAQARHRDELRIGVRPQDPPHSFIGGNGRLAGFDVDIARAIARHLGLRPAFVRVDELTRISFLKNGRIDMAVASINHTRERERQIDFSQTYFFSKQSFLVQRSKIHSLRDLYGKRVGFNRGSSAIGNWRDYLKAHGVTGQPPITEFADARVAVEAVKSGAVAGWGEDFEVLQSFAASDHSLVALPDPGGIGPKLDGVGIRENQSQLRDAIDSALQDIQRAGEYDRIYDRWFGPHSTTPVPRGGTIELWAKG